MKKIDLQIKGGPGAKRHQWVVCHGRLMTL